MRKTLAGFRFPTRLSSSEIYANCLESIRSDLEPLFEMLTNTETPGDQVPGVQYEVFKVRVRNSDTAKGKSGGYRVIYQRMAEGEIHLVTLYSTIDQDDIKPHEIRGIIDGSAPSADEPMEQQFQSLEPVEDPADG